MLLTQIVLGILLISITVVIHAIVLDELLKFIKRITPVIHKKASRRWKIIILTISVLGIFMSHTVQVWLWAGFYLSVESFASLEEALYFSISTFSTVGYGDVIIENKWRLIAGLESANGFMLFGWSTAFIFEIMSRLYDTTPLGKER